MWSEFLASTRSSNSSDIPLKIHHFTIENHKILNFSLSLSRRIAVDFFITNLLMVFPKVTVIADIEMSHILTVLSPYLEEL